jgi:hypothetical protein
MSIEKSNDIGKQTRGLPACSIVPQPTTLQRSPLHFMRKTKTITSEGSQAVPTRPFENSGRISQRCLGIFIAGNEIHFMTFKIPFLTSQITLHPH